MIKTLLSVLVLIAGLIIAGSVFMMAAPGVILIIAIWLLFRWLDKAGDQPSDNHDDHPRR